MKSLILGDIRSVLGKLARFARAIVIGFRGEALSVRAGNLAFITLTSLIPLLAVVFALIHNFRSSHIEHMVLKLMEDVLSPGGKAQAESTVRKLFSAANSRTAGGLSFGLLLGASAMLLRQLDAALNEVWDVQRKRSLLLSLGLYLSTLLIGPVFLGLAVLSSDAVKKFLFWLEFPFSAVVLGAGAIFFATLVFTALYKFAPHAVVTWRAALIGGLAAGISWDVLRRMYGSVAGLFFNANPLYGALGVGPLFLTWIFVVWFIVLAGARLAFAVEHANFHIGALPTTDHLRSAELIGTRVATLVAQAQLEEGLPPTTRSIAQTLALPGQRVADVVFVLERAGLLTIRRKQLFPKGDISSLTVGDISRAIRSTTVPPPLDPTHPDDAHKVFTSIDMLSAEKLNTISWEQLAKAAAEHGKV